MDTPGGPQARSDAADRGPAVRPARWFHLREGGQAGPVDLPEMRRLVLDGVVGPDTYVWADGMPDWMPARRVPALTPPPALREAVGWPAA